MITLALFTTGIILIYSDEIAPFRYLTDPAIFPKSCIAFVIGMILAVIGLSSAIWARLSLGRSLSGRVTVKQDHDLVVAEHTRLSGTLYTPV